MKKLLIGLTVISLLSIASVTYAGNDFRHERHVVRSGYDSPVIVKIFFGFGKHSSYWGDRHNHRYVEKRTYFKRRPYWKRAGYMKKFYRRGYDRPFWRHDNHDGYNRHDRHGRHDWNNRYKRHYR
jgi:hypothetical protein